MSETQPERADGGAYPSDYENQRTPEEDGRPPRPATEPEGAEGSSDSDGTWTDPATGEAHDQPDRDPRSPG
jgi:hypothetical protein